MRIRYFNLVRVAAISVFLGRAWQHIYWDAPYRALLWDERWMKGIIEGWTGRSWKEYVTDVNTDLFIQNLITGIGWFYVLCAIGALFILRLGKLGSVILWLGSISLAFLAALYCKEKFFFIGQFFEYTLQFSAPALLAILATKTNQRFTPKLVWYLKVAIALTFSCHGLYAIGFYPRPGNFVSMTMNILQASETVAIQFLNVVGVLDFILSILLFFPARWAKPALTYAVFWGFSTTIARIWAYFYWDSLDILLLQWLHESVMRFPHFLLPLALLIYMVSNNNLSKSKQKTNPL
jgi:hypothetical protein